MGKLQLYIGNTLGVLLPSGLPQVFQRLWQRAAHAGEIAPFFSELFTGLACIHGLHQDTQLCIGRVDSLCLCTLIHINRLECLL